MRAARHDHAAAVVPSTPPDHSIHMALLSGPAPLADDFFLLTRNPRTGAPYLKPSAQRLGLAAALLAELMLTGHLTIQSSVVVVRGSSPPNDTLAHVVLDQIAAARRPPPVGSCLHFLARRAPAERRHSSTPRRSPQTRTAAVLAPRTVDTTPTIRRGLARRPATAATRQRRPDDGAGRGAGRADAQTGSLIAHRSR